MDPVFYRIFGDFTSSDRNAGSFYVKCAVGWDDGRRDLLGGVSWKYGGSNEWAAGFGKRGGDSGSHHARDHVVLVRDLKDRGAGRSH